jgi:hypothetical protein
MKNNVLKWVLVDCGYACGGVGIDIKTNIIKETAPIFKWMKGKHSDILNNKYKVIGEI